jgi:hemolysin activation/secretion protein
MSPTRLFAWVCLTLGCWVTAAEAAPEPSADPTRQLQPPSARPLPEPEVPLPSPIELLQPSIAPQAESAEPTAKTLTIDRFEVTGSTVFSDAELDQVTAPFTKRSLTQTELFQARDAITQLYLSRGYISSGAYIPPQKVQSKTIEIRVVEGGLESIQVNGTRRLSPDYIRQRLAIATQAPLSRTKLLTALQTLQLNPLIQTLSTELSASPRAGRSLLAVTVKEAQTFDLQTAFENSRSPSVGTNVRRIQLSEGNLLGFGDRITLSYSNTLSSQAGDLNYTLPISPRNATLSFSFGLSGSTVIERPFNALDIESSSRYAELTLRQPLMETPTQQFAVGITASQRQSRATLLKGSIPFPALGADESGQTRLTALRFFQEWTQRSQQSVFALRSQFNLGLSALNASVSSTQPDSRFLSWRGQAQWVRLLAPDTLLLLRSDLQLSDQGLLPFEQFGLGGQETVRGYRQDSVLTDSGLFAAAELRLPVLRSPTTLLQVAPFMEMGRGWNHDPSRSGSTLASVGLGLRLQMSDRITARLDWGIPLIAVKGDRATLQEKGIYFSVIYNPF